MLVIKNYRTNKNGDIIGNERVETICDKCGKHWISSYISRKNKVVKEDLCRRCLALKSISEQKIRPCELSKRYPRKIPPKIEITCLGCGTKKLKNPSQVHKVNNFCSVGCRDQYWVKTKYGHLEHVFEKNINEVAYLIGLIMGDGHIRNSGKQTVRIGIAFDFSGKWNYLMEQAKNVLDKLQINWFEEQKSHHNCKMIGFVLSNYLLGKYGVFHYGDKFKTQPFPSETIYQNINYAAGLLNSDGYYRQYYRFVNTVRSIVDSFSACLSLNGIKHTITECGGKLDQRTNNISKKQYLVYVIGGKKMTEKLRQNCSFELKS